MFEVSETPMVFEDEDVALFTNVKRLNRMLLCSVNFFITMARLNDTQRQTRRQFYEKLVPVEKVDLFEAWLIQTATARSDERIRRMYSVIPPSDIGRILDGIGTRTEPAVFEAFRQQIDLRGAPLIKLGTFDGHHLLVHAGFCHLAPTWLSRQHMLDGEDPEATNGDYRERVAFLLSIFRNTKGEGDVVSTGSESSAGSHDSGYHSGSDTSVTRTSFKDNLVGTNILKRVFQIGTVHSYRRDDPDARWKKTRFVLVANLDDRHAWLVLDPDTVNLVDEEGTSEDNAMYLCPGQRLGRFCNSPTPFSYARLIIEDEAFDPMLHDWPPQSSRMSSTGPPYDYWETLFASGGKFERSVRVATIYQDHSFAIGNVVWHKDEDEMLSKLVRTGDGPILRKDVDLNNALGKYTLDHPKHPSYTEKEFDLDRNFDWGRPIRQGRINLNEA